MTICHRGHRRILVLGGTGFVGRSFVARWLADIGPGTTLVVPSRHAARARALASLPGVELVQADVHDPARLAALVAGCDAVVNLIAVLHGSAARFERVHVELAQQIGAACRRAGVRRLVHVSALGVPVEGSASAPSNYLRSKARGEQALRASGLDLTVLRPSVIFGAEDRFLNLFARLQALAPMLPLAGAHARFQPVWVEDVAQALVNSLRDDRCIGRTFECAGPEVHTLAELVRLAGAWSGHRRLIVPLPEWAGRLQALVLGCLPGEPLMSADNLASMRVPNVASGTVAGLAELGITPAALSVVMPPLLSGGPGSEDLRRARARRG
ncbi:NADH dehydrogenase [Sphaerotilus hippei]|uniref:NADH dehydrogenase n=1 Tax=Sphaerotilus hippei TaxID=744406 RepID=A0A318HDA0_9BURK|nr:complex I NDUFA9 subunit family protein [Sphaerotilus hippei]PXW99189.1 NADH dehydrogenase [Sphaerotilus hippei]